MKLTKSKLKQIIKEELEDMGVIPDDPRYPRYDERAVEERNRWKYLFAQQALENLGYQGECPSKPSSRKGLAEGLNPDKVNIFKKLKSGKWGKVSWPEEKELPKGYIKIPANKKGFPYDDYEERQETLDKM
tara:strand:- start:499 stop:891 length:393 start_codon:yes stop_codon:yes gene_type:complete